MHEYKENAFLFVLNRMIVPSSALLNRVIIPNFAATHVRPSSANLLSSLFSVLASGTFL